ncbi:adenosylmethionine decarboxylase [Enterobacteriaceae bacterium H11S18]|uniref:adenosylmethionine decarboxylase n=1 Tax=Dryocola clanedunensis TaxID=2925396 RepID=UPI0022F11B00|nr:adenosylmethionine decarboxylase [Dryocola clanedunensis]MCT4708835.1 adenosylmethionine decarboxylase [Dryocola clanedunensis]
MDDTGHHYLLDIVTEDTDFLKDEKKLQEFFSAVIDATRFSILGFLSHKFTAGGEGVTGIYLLSESHLSYHTYPESDYMSIDIYTCGSECLKAVEEIERRLKHVKRSVIRYAMRGSRISVYGGSGLISEQFQGACYESQR